MQGDSNDSTLTPLGEEQAKRTAAALSRMQFDRCAMPLESVVIFGTTTPTGQQITSQTDCFSQGCAHQFCRHQPSMTPQMLHVDQEVLLLCSCFTSPIRRAALFAELAWGDRQAPLLELPTLKEAHLGWRQGMRQGGACLQLSHISVFLSAALQCCSWALCGGKQQFGCCCLLKMRIVAGCKDAPG